MSKLVTLELNPETARLNYDRRLELELTSSTESVLDHFNISEILAHFGVSEVLDEIGQKEACDHFGLVEAE